MEHSLAWKAADALFFAGLLCVSAGFMAYHFVSKSELLRLNFKFRFGEEESKVKWVLFERLLGVVFFGIVPAFLLLFGFDKNLSHYGLSFSNLDTFLVWTLLLSPVLVLMNYANCKKPDNLALYPQIRKQNWSMELLVLSALSWIAYLLAYEFMFRGFLLFISLEYLGVWSAIALNISIYALVHVPKGYKEAVGAIPLGIVLGLITIITGNIWFAFVVHVVLALSNEWLSLRVHPEIRFVKK